ncbi:MAG TPA: beta-ribofuranosylaminobenzene 5'-phosphate synthase family protein [Pirellulales bacterium]|nr:beta-ribofuranosylaminobenzene 5'-phosphate synthase family protein [Pirellulales bacterium]
MILEGLITTINADGSVNLSPMGPIVDASMRELVLRPYQTSTTYRNLKRTGQGVLHVTDDVELLARAAIGRVEPPPAMLPAQAIEGWILADVCRWYAFKVRSLDDSEERSTITAEVVDSGRIRDFFGFNRAKHAVLEAAILATRVKFLPAAEIEREFERLAVPVQKTAGDAERRAFEFLSNYVCTAIGAQACDVTVEAATGASPVESKGGTGAPPVESRSIAGRGRPVLQPGEGARPSNAPGEGARPSIAKEGRAPRPSNRVIQITAPSRLHFGMFSFGLSNVRQFGGVGAMLDAPALELEISPADRLETVGKSPERVREFAERAARQADWIAPEIPCRIEVKRAPPAHVGLGSGTQLGLAVAMGLNAFFNGPWRTPQEFARAAGRGRRSAIGLYGAMSGGLLIEAGKFAEEEISPLVSRIKLPDEWRFVLCWPHDEAGLSGEAELQAFQRLPATKLAATEALCREALLELAPAAIEGDFERFSESLFRFGRLAGDCFAAEQGGPYANERIAQLIAELRSAGVCGVGQSSWGPLIFALARDQLQAQSITERLSQADLGAERQTLVAACANRGVRICERAG